MAPLLTYSGKWMVPRHQDLGSWDLTAEEIKRLDKQETLLLRKRKPWMKKNSSHPVYREILDDFITIQE